MADTYAPIKWDQSGERKYETGVSNGVIYLRDDSGAYPKGVAWNGLTTITESPSGAEATPMYADNIKYLNLYSTEDYAATVEAYTYPDAFKECIGEYELTKGVYYGQQVHKTFGLCYRTIVGNDLKGNEYGYKLHFVYGAVAAPSEQAHSTVNDSPEAETMSWEISTTPVAVTSDGTVVTASLTIDSTTADATKLKALEEIIYGSTTANARLPLPSEILTLMKTE